MLVVSNLVQAILWTGCVYEVVDEIGLGTQTCCGSLLKAFMLFCLSCCQLHYLLDILLAMCLGVPEPRDIRRRGPVVYREFASKILESAPQLYFQSYVLFRTGSLGDPVMIASVVLSGLSLSHGLLKAVTADIQCLYQPLYCVVSFLWLATDQLVRSGGYALVLSSHSRSFGILLILVVSLASSSIYSWFLNRGASESFCLFFLCGVVGGFFACHSRGLSSFCMFLLVCVLFFGGR